jgi:hypothetical protein
MLPAKSTDPLIQRFLEDPKSIRLYLGLAAYPQSARETLTESVEPARLLKSAGPLLLFGNALKFEKGRLIFPGAQKSWESLLGFADPASAPEALLVHDGGRAILLYSCLSAAPEQVQSYLTSAPEILASYYEILRRYKSDTLSETTAVFLAQELTRMLQFLAVGPGGLTRVPSPPPGNAPGNAVRGHNSPSGGQLGGGAGFYRSAGRCCP